VFLAKANATDSWIERLAAQGLKRPDERRVFPWIDNFSQVNFDISIRVRLREKCGIHLTYQNIYGIVRLAREI
jgi:hypothetical protein